MAVVAAMLPALSWAAPNVEFNPQFLQGGAGGQMDLSRFERGEALPGTYSADIKVNGVIVARRDVDVRVQDNGDTAAFLGIAVVEAFGIDAAKLPQGDGALPLPTVAFATDELSHYVPEATAHFDAGEQLLEVSIPQLYLARDPRGWVSPELWDNGITSARVGYSISHQQMQYFGQSRHNTTATLNAGINLGDWRLRHDGFLSQGSEAALRYRPGRSYAQRNLAALGMQLTIGEAGTYGDLFDGVNYRGASLTTDPRMLPDSQRDYAPVVRGVAQTNAQVIIRQRDYVLYQTNVAAGPFEIDDLYGTSYAGDLDVEVIESDGRVQRFSVPFAAVPQLLRAGQQRVGVTAGQLQDNWLRDSPGFVEVSLRRGLSNQFTGYGGVTGTEGYGAIVFGGAFNTRLGAFAGDVTVAHTALPTDMAGFGRTMKGQSYRVSYSKNITTTDTNIAVAAYRYSTDGYLTLNEAVRLRQDLFDGLGGQGIARQRSRMDLTVNQRLGDRGGSLYVNGSSINYWNLSQRRTNFALGYSNTLGTASYSLSAQRSMERNLFGGAATRETNSINFNLSLPLGRAPTAPRFNGSVARSNDGRNDLRAGVSGGFGQQHQGSYSASASRYNQQSSSFDVSLGYQASTANLSAGYSQSSGNRSISLGASGGVLLHQGGVTFAQQLGDTIAIVEVPNAAGAGIGNSAGVKTNAKGFAVVPYLQPYRRNEVTVDPMGLPMDVELKQASAMAVPTAGAVVKVLVPTESGRNALIEARQSDGTPLPFGLDVYNEAGVVVGVVGQASRLWVRGIDVHGQLTVRWSTEDGSAECRIDFDTEGNTAGSVLHSVCASAVAPNTGVL
ncbi:fimbria/pilus outer membrane usher protein [Stenotrophomonas indicatrix]|uniref:fimbria/pilus outer membrane usher protein n=1 Tax=Stenotrophomonas indicatrix TaxID=2045451 RepID=UPI0015E03372|nr:fimbria/pilus outer membrane usher protein [Stenotrophomonas indicatrix]MBA0098757.1 fimbrial biogenesis outer membrane usher protein [Stenotrophomonas indicatrix]